MSDGRTHIPQSGDTPTLHGSRRERLRRAAEDAERLYRVRMHSPHGPTVADDQRIDGILSLDLLDALGFVDQLIGALGTCEYALLTGRSDDVDDALKAIEEVRHGR